MTTAPVRRLGQWFVALCLVGCASLSIHAEPQRDMYSTDKPAGESPSRISDEVIPLLTAEQVVRPKPVVELGNPFLSSGPIDEGFELPTGAVWQPSLLIYGNFRSALQTFDDGVEQRAEWANRLDVFANLQFSATERLLVGVRPVDDDNKVTGYNFTDPDEGWQESFNIEIETFFFEGDFGEIFANADPEDRHSLDWGFAVGRQPILAQDGLLINDTIDAVGVVRNNILIDDVSNLRATFLYGWNEIHRGHNEENNDEHLIALLTHADLSTATVEADFVYIHDEDELTSGFFWGVGGIKRWGELNLTGRVLGSQAMRDDSPDVASGHLLFGELSWSPHGTDDLLYFNAFWGIDEFTSAARAPDRGGPLGRTGILFAAVELGRYGAPLGNRADESVGGAVGYQMFFENKRKQVVVELGARDGTEGDTDAMLGLGGRYQQAIGQHWVLQVDAFGTLEESRDPGWGARLEIGFRF